MDETPGNPYSAPPIVNNDPGIPTRARRLLGLAMYAVSVLIALRVIGKAIFVILATYSTLGHHWMTAITGLSPSAYLALVAIGLVWTGRRLRRIAAPENNFK